MSVIVPDHLRRYLVQLAEEEAALVRLGESFKRAAAELAMRKVRCQALVDYLLEHLPADSTERARLMESETDIRHG